MDKQKLRTIYREKRLLPEGEVENKSELICRRLLNEADWAVVHSLHIYRPIAELNEIDTDEFIKKLETDYPKIKIDIGNQTKNSNIPTVKYDAVIVPVLAFDKELYRLGWGGGWYDRFLATQPRALKIGLAYDSSLMPTRLPAEAHDIRLDKVITETASY